LSYQNLGVEGLAVFRPGLPFQTEFNKQLLKALLKRPVVHDFR
jgi:hypothetical protein